MDVWDRAGKNNHLLRLSLASLHAVVPPAATRGGMFGLTVGGGKGGGHLIRHCGYELSQGWLRHSPAEALFSGTISSMGSRNWVKRPASSCAQPYFSTSTSNRDQGFSLVMCRSSPAGGDREKSQ